MSLLQSTTFEQAVKAVRAKIIQASGIDPELVLNADSLRGPEARKWLTNKISVAPRTNDCFIIFDVQENQSLLYGATHESDDAMGVITPYDFLLKIYGMDAPNMAKKIFANFKNALVVYDLRDLGVKVDGISQISSANEFINNTLWIRRDITISVLTRSEIEVPKSDDVEYFGSTTVLKV